MVRFYKQFWKRRKSRKSAFGGTIKSKEEIDALSKKINSHEAKEFEAFEEDFDKVLEEL